MDNRMNDKELGATDSIKRKLDEIDYNLFCMKDKDFVMKMMSTYGGLTEKPKQKSTWRWFKARGNEHPTCQQFKYKETFANHYLFRHCVDNHNNLRHSVPSIEGTIKTHCWPTRVFSFLIAISEVNAYLAMKEFGMEK